MHFSRLHFSCVHFHAMKGQPCLWTGDTWIYLTGAPPGESGTGWMVTLQFGLNVQVEISDIPHRSVMTLWQNLSWWHGAMGLSADGIDFSASSATSQKPIPFLTPNDFLLSLHIFLVSFCLLNSEVLPVLEDWADDFYIKQMGFFYRRNYNNFLHLKGYCLWSMHYCKTFLFHKVLIKIILKQDLKSILCDCISGVVDMFTQ